jgi:hypothetical protein
VIELKGYVLGLDPAKVEDYSALAACSVEWDTCKKGFVSKLVNIKRLQEVDYNVIVDWAIEALRTPRFKKDVDFGPILVMDAGGVGVAVLDMFHHKGVSPVAVTITPGDSVSRPKQGEYRVGKARLVGKFLAVYSQGRFKIPVTQLRDFVQLHKEIVSFRRLLNNKGNAIFESPARVHDDMFIACALEAWFLEEAFRPRRRFKIPPVASFCVNGDEPQEYFEGVDGEPHVNFAWDPVAAAKAEGEARRLAREEEEFKQREKEAAKGR